MSSSAHPPAARRGWPPEVDSVGASFENPAATDFWVTPGSMAQFPTGPLVPAGLAGQVAAVPGVASVNPAQPAFAGVDAGRVLLQGFSAAADNTRLRAEITPEVDWELVTGGGG